MAPGYLGNITMSALLEGGAGVAGEDGEARAEGRPASRVGVWRAGLGLKFGEEVPWRLQRAGEVWPG